MSWTIATRSPCDIAVLVFVGTMSSPQRGQLIPSEYCCPAATLAQHGDSARDVASVPKHSDSRTGVVPQTESESGTPNTGELVCRASQEDSSVRLADREALPVGRLRDPKVAADKIGCRRILARRCESRGQLQGVGAAKRMDPQKRERTISHGLHGPDLQPGRRESSQLFDRIIQSGGVKSVSWPAGRQKGPRTRADGGG